MKTLVLKIFAILVIGAVMVTAFDSLTWQFFALGAIQIIIGLI